MPDGPDRPATASLPAASAPTAARTPTTSAAAPPPGGAGSGGTARAAVTTDAGAAQIEASLLLVGAVRQAARTIGAAALAADPRGAAPEAGAAPREVVVITGCEPPDFAALDRFERVADDLSDGLGQALAAAAAIPEPGPNDALPPGVGGRDVDKPRTTRGTPLTGGLVGWLEQANLVAGGVGKLVDSVTNLIQTISIRTRFGAVEASVDDRLLARELAGALLGRTPRPRVRQAPLLDQAARDSVERRLHDLGVLAGRAAAAADRVDATAAGSPLGAGLREAARAAADFRTALTAPGSEGDTPLDTIAAQAALRTALTRGAIVIGAAITASGAGQFSRQSVLGGLFGDPTFEICAAAVAGYAAWTGPELDLVATGNVRAAMPYQAVRDVPRDHVDIGWG